MECSSNGSPVPTMLWYRMTDDGAEQIIGDYFGSRSKMHSNGTLQLLELGVTDSGRYTCTADNGVYPVLRKTITLKIHGGNP